MDENKDLLEKNDSDSSVVNQPSNENLTTDSSVNDEIIFCCKCGKQNTNSSKFCIDCGHNLKTIEDSIKSTTKNIKEAISNNDTYKNLTTTSYSTSYTASWDNKDMVNFIQKNPEYYIPKFEQMQEFEKSVSWNWASFFIGPLWFLYRKMYALGFGLMALSFLLSFIPIIGGLFSGMVLSILTGLYGNYLYVKHIEKKLSEVSNLAEDVRHRILLTRGGVNLVLPIVLVVICALSILIIFGLFGAMLFMSPFLY